MKKLYTIIILVFVCTLGRDIIGINAESINLWGGGIHCITQHMPAS